MLCIYQERVHDSIIQNSIDPLPKNLFSCLSMRTKDSVSLASLAVEENSSISVKHSCALQLQIYSNSVNVDEFFYCSFLEDLSIGPFHLIDIGHDSNFDDQDHGPDVRLSCFAHTMQLCIRDGLRNAAHVPKILAKCQTLAKFSHKSSKMADLLEQLNVQIKRMNVTRWNSEFLLIKSISSIAKTDLEAITSVMGQSGEILKQ